MDVEKVKEYYEKPNRWSLIINSSIYKNYFKKQESAIIGSIEKLIKESKGKKVLDAGCGYGRYTRKYVRMGFEVYAIDLSQNMIKRVKDICKNAVVGNLTSTNFPDNFFDLVTCIEVFDHLDSAVTAVLEFKRILKSDGILLVTVLNKRSIFYGAHRVLRAIFKVCRINFGTPISKGYSKDELEEILKSNFNNYFIFPTKHLVLFPMQYIAIASNNNLKDFAVSKIR